MKKYTIAVLATLMPCAVGAAQTVDSTWLAVDSIGKTATLNLIAGLTPLNGGLNFNGFKNGELTLVVPLGWTLVLNFTNKDQALPHSVVVVPATTALPPVPGAAAYPGSATHHLTDGLAPGQSETIRFTADHPGYFFLYCGVPGHGVVGMYLRLNVWKSAKTAYLKT
jgi:sulfocyanin